MKLIIAPTARRQVRELTAWWDEHRPSARVRVEEAFAEALAALLRHPELGVRYRARPQYRTWPLSGTPYALFYRVDRKADVIEIVAVWSMARGSPPKLRG